MKKEEIIKELEKVLFQYGVSAHKIGKETHIYSFTGIIDMEKVRQFLSTAFSQVRQETLKEIIGERNIETEDREYQAVERFKKRIKQTLTNLTKK